MHKLILIGLTVALAGCGGEPASQDASPGNDAIDRAATPDSDGVVMNAGPALVEPQPETDQPGAGVIPAAVRGRWGLVPADCTSTRGDAKGLVTISDTQLRFYESRATLGEIAESDASRIVADFDFMGEGQSWQRRMILDAQGDGQTLIRRETGADAMPGPLRYAKCEAQ